jgi:hypothetical protein
MPPSKTRFVTACQQMLALGVVLAALTPAAGVVTLDVVRENPSGSGYTSLREPAGAGQLAAYARAQSRESVVPDEVVDPKVTEYSLTAPSGSKRAATTPLAARTRPGAERGSTAVTSTPEAVKGYGAVGVTWAPDQTVPDEELDLTVRTRTEQDWSEWMELEYHDEHGPDPDSAEGRKARPGSDVLLVGDVDQVQVRALTTDGTVPADMRLAVIDPGEADRTAVEKPALDTNTTATDAAPAVSAPAPATPADTDTDTDTDTADGLALRAAVFTPKPVIYSRAQWGANEALRDKGSLRYYEVHAGFVHHTVNANTYTREQVPGIIRSIYAYHTQSKGWSDVGYNFLVDRFGRIWEGRYGGIDRAPVGAHTLGYNDYAFAMSAIGNFDVASAPAAMVQAYGALFAWKLSLHGIDASSTRQWVGSKNFQAINGHRDAGSTACPGRYLYAKIPEIRRLAAQAQRGWSGRELESDLASTAHPDLIVRRASDGQGFILPTGGMTKFASAKAVSVDPGDREVASPDLTGDGRADLVRVSGGTMRVHPGDGSGGFGAGLASRGLVNHDLLTAAGDLSGDGRKDLVARRTTDGRLDVYLGNGAGGFVRRPLAAGWGRYNAIAASGDLNGDGRDDLLARDSGGQLWRFLGATGRRLMAPVALPGAWGGYDTITGFGDFTSDGLPDLLVAKNGKPGYVRPALADGSFGRPVGEVPSLRAATSMTAANLTGNGAPDVLGRQGGRLVTYANAGTFELGAPIATGVDLSGSNLVLNAGDWDRDGFGDLVTRSSENGMLYLRSGDGRGRFAKALKLATDFGSVGLLAAVGDMTGDGYPDLVGQPAGKDLRIYPGNGLNGLKPSYVAYGPVDAGRQVGIGRWDADGAPDSLFRKGSQLKVYPGNGPGGLTSPQALELDVTAYDWVLGVSDLHLGGHADVIVRAKATGFLWAFTATADGLESRRLLGDGMNAYDLAG